MNEGQRIAQLESDHRHFHECLHRIEKAFKDDMSELKQGIATQRAADQKRNDDRLRWALIMVLGAMILTGGGTVSLQSILAFLAKFLPGLL